MLQQQAVNIPEDTVRETKNKDSLTVAKERWQQKRQARPNNRPSPAEAPLLTQAKVNDTEHLRGCIKQRIARMERLLAKQQRNNVPKSRSSEQINEMLSPAIRSVIRGRELALRYLQESDAV